MTVPDGGMEAMFVQIVRDELHALCVTKHFFGEFGILRDDPTVNILVDGGRVNENAEIVTLESE